MARLKPLVPHNAEGTVKRWIWIVVIVAVVAAGVLGWPRLRAAQAEKTALAIESVEDPAQRAQQALALLEAHPELSEKLRTSVFLAGFRGAQEQGGAAAIQFCDRVMALNMPTAERSVVVASLDRALLDTGEPGDAARADSLAREAAVAGDYTAASYLRMVWQHVQNPMSDPWTAVELARAGSALNDTTTADEWPGAFDSAYGGVLSAIAEDRGLDAAFAVTDSVLSRARDSMVPGAIYANVYRLLVDEDPSAAVDAARNLTTLRDYKGGSVLNDVAYDMTERSLAPDVAVQLAEAALALASSSYDSVGVLDTAGWAHYRAGNDARAVEYLAKAFSMLDETPSYQNEIVQHLVTAYGAAGKTDEAIDLLALIVSRSVDQEDPARAELSKLLKKRDGDDAAFASLVEAKLAQGIETAPEFALTDRGGKTVALADLRGSVVVVCFWSYG
jgi:tetratricopeptide (TPR) repeat protein